MRRSALIGLFACASLAATAAHTQKSPIQVRQPAFPAGTGPLVLIDAGHFNEGRAELAPLVELLGRDGLPRFFP